MVSFFLRMAIPILTTRIRKVGSRINEVGPRIDKVGPRINKRGIRIKNQESGKARNNEWGRASYMCARPLINIWSAPYHHSTKSFFNQFQPCQIQKSVLNADVRDFKEHPKKQRYVSKYLERILKKTQF